MIDGKVRFAVTAFSDREHKPSVDRSSMRHDPRETRFRHSDGVAEVLAREVRAIGAIRVDPGDSTSARTYSVDVIHRPILRSADEPTENLAHCQVECIPGIKPGHFNKRLREALAILASTRGWVVEPGSPPES